MEYLTAAARCLVGVVFLVSSVSKVAGRGAFGSFVKSVHALRVLPRSVARPVALLVVAGEFAVWILLAVPLLTTQLAGYAIAVCLLTSFAVGVGLSIRGGVRATCRCFGGSSAPLGLRHVVRNVVLTVISAAGAVAALNDGRLQIGGAVLASLAGLLFGCLVAVLDDILDLFQPMNKATGVSVAGDK